MTNPRTTMKSGILFCGTLLVCMGLLELGLRVYNPFPFRVKGGRIVLTANRVETYYRTSQKLEPLVHVTRNSAGFRGPNPPANLDPYLSIIAIGGSTTECRALSDTTTWPAIVEDQLKTKFAPVWLNNAGLDGHSTFGHAVLLKDHVAPLRPKIVLFLAGINDRATTAPLAFDTAQMTVMRSWSPWALWLALGRHSELFNTAYNVYRYSLARKARLAYEPEVDIATLGSVEASDPEIAAEVCRHEREYIPMFRQRLRGLVNECRAHHILPVLITQPMLWGKGIDDLTKVNLETVRVDPSRPAYNGKMNWAVMEAYNHATLATATDCGVFSIDLANQMPKSSRLFYDCCHYTIEGARTVGTIVAGALDTYCARTFPQYLQGTPPHPKFN
jgi:hypothetical protein